MEHQMQPGPPGKKKMSPVVIAVIVVAVLGLGGILCCFGAVGFGAFQLVDAEKSYYSACEYATTVEECQQCCRTHGHSGHAYGEILNEGDRTCGCL